MKPRRWLLLAVGIGLLCRAAAQANAAEDAFLDHPFPAGLPWKMESFPPADGKGPNVSQQMLPIPSFWKGVALLGQMAGKKVLLPTGLSEWPDEESETNWGMSLGAGNKKSVRELFQRLSMILGLDWHYDSGQDAIILTPKWERNDSRPSKALLDLLVRTKPIRWTQLQWGGTNPAGGRDMVLDDWRVAFDALISKPENFRSAGTLRLYYSCHGKVGINGGFPIPDSYVETLIDNLGEKEEIVLIGQERETNKEDPGDFAYFLFDESGKLVRGGVYAIAEGWGGEMVKTEADGTAGITIDVGWGSFAMNPDHFHFALVNGDLTFQGITDSKGAEVSGDGKTARLVFKVAGER